MLATVKPAHRNRTTRQGQPTAGHGKGFSYIAFWEVRKGELSLHGPLKCKCFTGTMRKSNSHVLCTNYQKHYGTWLLLTSPYIICSKSLCQGPGLIKLPQLQLQLNPHHCLLTAGTKLKWFIYDVGDSVHFPAPADSWVLLKQTRYHLEQYWVEHIWKHH